jgi:hypothetical protein
MNSTKSLQASTIGEFGADKTDDVEALANRLQLVDKLRAPYP